MLACAVMLVAAGLAAATVDARTPRETKTLRSHFHGGAGCGDTDRVSLRLPRGARHVRVTRPRIGQKIPNEKQPGQVATVSRISVTRRKVVWTATAGGSVCLDAGHDPTCIDPDSPIFCGPGWNTHTTRFSVRFRRAGRR